MKKAAIFDLDGTLSDSIMSMKYSGDKTMAEFGYGPFSVQDYKYFVGDGAANLVKRALIKSGDTGLTHFEAAYARYKEIFQANCMYALQLCHLAVDFPILHSNSPQKRCQFLINLRLFGMLQINLIDGACDIFCRAEGKKNGNRHHHCQNQHRRAGRECAAVFAGVCGLAGGGAFDRKSAAGKNGCESVMFYRAAGAAYRRPGGIWQAGICGRAPGRACPTPTAAPYISACETPHPAV